MSKAPELVDVDPDEVRDRFTRFVAVAIVLTTLAAAGVEWMRSVAEDNSGEAARTAQVLSVRQNGEQFRLQQAAAVDLESFGLSSEQRTRDALARQVYIVQGKDHFLKEANRWNKLANLTAVTNGFNSALYGPETDWRFPTGFYADRLRQIDMLAAQQDAENDRRADWSRRVTDFTAILTVLAVALYLLGLSLSLKVAIRKALAGLGVALLVFGMGWSGVVQVSTPANSQKQDERAAEAYAAGRDALLNAPSKPDKSGYEEAIKELKQAISLRPGFGRAYLLLSEATFDEGSPQRSGFVSVTDPKSLQLSTQYLREAMRLGLEKEAVANLGFQEYLLALPQGRKPQDQAALTQSVEHTKTAIRNDPKDLHLHFNLGAALLAAGRQGEAKAAYTEGLKLTIKGDDWGTEQLVGGALTDLGILLGRRPDLSSQVAQMKNYIVAAAAARNLTPGTKGGSVEITAFYRYAHQLQIRLKVPGYDTKTDVASVQYYYRDPAGPDWAVLSPISGKSDFRTDSTGGPDAFYVQSDYGFQANSCLPKGDFRVEVYLNGQLAKSMEANDPASRTDVLDLVARRYLDLDVRFCRPLDWISATESNGFYGGYVSKAGAVPNDPCSTAAKACGIYVFRFQDPTLRDTNMLTFRDLTMKFAADNKFFPGKETYNRTVEHYFSNLSNFRDDLYLYPGGRIMVMTGFTTDRAMLVTIVYGPDQFFESLRAYRIYESAQLASLPGLGR